MVTDLNITVDGLRMHLRKCVSEDSDTGDINRHIAVEFERRVVGPDGWEPIAKVEGEILCDLVLFLQAFVHGCEGSKE